MLIFFVSIAVTLFSRFGEPPSPQSTPAFFPAFSPAFFPLLHSLLHPHPPSLLLCCFMSLCPSACNILDIMISAMYFAERGVWCDEFNKYEIIFVCDCMSEKFPTACAVSRRKMARDGTPSPIHTMERRSAMDAKDIHGAGEHDASISAFL